jgi:hypothetical protein
MGMFDTVHDGGRFEQVKLWGKALRHFHVGDTVGLPRGGLGPDGVYNVAMRVGGFVHVVDGVIVGWHDEPGAGPQLTTRGYRYETADYPGGPFGAWYRYADAPPVQRSAYDAAEDCPRPALAAVGSRPPSGIDIARAAAQADVSARLASGLSESERLEAARTYLSDVHGYVQVARAAVAQLLGVEDEPDRAGRRLVALLSSLPEGAPEWPNAAGTVARCAAFLPASDVAECLRLLAAELSAEEASDDDRSDTEDDSTHPAFARRRARVADRDRWLDELRRYGDRDFLPAAESAVARHGSAVLSAVPLRFWGWDIVVPELAAPLLRPVLGRDFTVQEQDWLLDALLDVPDRLESLDAVTLEEALRRIASRCS